MVAMIERVARALCIASGVDPEKPADAGDGWFVPGWKLYAMHARTAMQAMREPTEAMVEGGAVIVSNQDMDHDRPLPTLSNAYRAMIDAALSEFAQ